MNKALRYAFMAVMLLAMAVATGCAKKVGTDTPTGEGGGYTQADVENARKVQAVLSNKTIYFAFDRYEIKPEGKEALNQSAALIKQFPIVRVLIEGHTDNRGTAEYNLALGERRARAAYEYLVNLGVRPEQLEMVSYGKERPAVEGNNESAWAKNRRCEFRVVFPPIN
ncbi:peptidoglycan-associated lipoprotein Pal [Desulfovibrio litoralis]|uniref:Peptidoglycan-associated lipoprotein n=1 Tax=Desulfovibrio litoralis DSM 11393 TaxID=1121455 RepID=A0A1M7SFR7_9BACT|nr:peptidoglycan-associated lipoprotein Pal [Desulfovibrio litoralis]SHN57327.1 peptidoglycan-associated lipoprotein [Desulfovibrio litoralis DSM 11393]